MNQRYVKLKQPFEYNEFSRTCLKLSDAELQKYESLVWSSSYILPTFVQEESLDANTLEFLKLSRKPCFAIVNQHLNNICESVGSKDFFSVSSNESENEKVNGGFDEKQTGGKNGEMHPTEETLIEILGKIYQYLDNLSLNEHHKVVCLFFSLNQWWDLFLEKLIEFFIPFMSKNSIQKLSNCHQSILKHLYT